MLNVIVFDDVRVASPKSEYFKDHNVIYARTSAEFNKLLDDGVRMDVVCLDHDLVGETTRESARRLSEMVQEMPYEERPTIVVVSGSPPGAEYLYGLFYDHCPDVWKDYAGREIGLEYGVGW